MPYFILKTQKGDHSFDKHPHIGRGLPVSCQGNSASGSLQGCGATLEVTACEQSVASETSRGPRSKMFGGIQQATPPATTASVIHSQRSEAGSGACDARQVVVHIPLKKLGLQKLKCHWWQALPYLALGSTAR